ncbi:astacin-like metalloendopeptidase [Sciurus carolinensis]|uniref:astacin-like metalloendopeptidase n=1 Tax=Sciurus carolinensis TaxID=30640 RepID=UPI001FB46DB3|nr:astacin-like metalloendopeptidase [Sciurus carolinensis]
MGGLWLWGLGLLALPGWILGATSASRCPGVCDPGVPEDLTPEGTQVSWDEDIPAINQGLIPEETPDSSFLVEGDIIRPSPFRLLSVTSNKWPKGASGAVEVPFLLSSKYDEPSRRVILEALAEFERVTCIRFVAYKGQRDFISVIPMTGCFSGVGRSGGMQVVSLAPACLRRGRGIVLHELMHVLGFWHEHSRADRDHYIRVNWNEILPGFEINFIKSRNSNMLAPYDYSSVLHYGRLAFSRRGQPTIIPLWAPSVHIGQRWNLSASDITRVRRLYDCSPSAPDSQGRGFQDHTNGRSRTPDSRPRLQRLLEALSVEPRNPRAGGQPVAAGPVERKLHVEAVVRPAQTAAAAGTPDTAAEQPQLAPFPEAGDPPAPAPGSPALPGDCVPRSPFRGMSRD